MSTERTFFALALTLALGGCSVITGFGDYTSRGDAGGGMDGGADAGADSGVDGGGEDDGGMMAVCDPDCADGEECVDGACMCGAGPTCGAGNACCDGTCTDISTIENCGACGNSCPMGPNFTATCTGESCAGSCNAGFANCDGEMATGCEQSLIDPEHCGACGNACGATELCASSGGAPSCVSSCSPGQTECDGACIDTDSSPVHCGGCGNACPSSPPGATGSMCSGGTCRPICRAGFDDCDGDPTNGCEMLRQFWLDNDGDGFGDPTSTAMTGCVVPPNYADNDRDCNDGDRFIFPGAPERCNGISDDCDSNIDETFTCAQGETQSCTVSMGTCTAIGTQACTSTCGGFGSCVVTEVCDRADTDCDGFVDESVLGMGTARVISTTSVRGLRAAWGSAGGTDRVGLVYERSGSTYFQALLGDGSTVGPETRVASDAPSADVAWTGSYFVVAVADSPARRIDVFAFSATGLLGATSGRSLSRPPNRVQLDRIGSSDQLAILETSGDSGLGFQAGLTWMRVGSSHTTAPAFISDTVLESSGGTRVMDFPTVTRTSTGAFVAFSHFRMGGGSGLDDIITYFVEPGGVASMAARAESGDGHNEAELDAVWDPVTDVVGLLFRKVTFSGAPQDWYLGTYDGRGVQLTITRRLGIGTRSIAAAGDSNFAISGIDSAGTLLFDRHRSPDLAAVPGSLTPAAGHVDFLVGLGGSAPNRYLGFAESGLSVQPVLCR